MFTAAVTLLTLSILIGCTGTATVDSAPPSIQRQTSRISPAKTVPLPPTEQLPPRVVAFGDVHGDFEALIRTLSIARVIDDDGRWNGGKTIVVQSGDILDKTDNDRKVLDFLIALRTDARAVGGDVLLIAGNHELMNIEGNFGYVTPASCDAFADLDNLHPERLPDGIPFPAGLSENCRRRAAAFAPGAPYARILSEFGVVRLVGDSLVVHGGVLPEHLVDRSLEQMNADFSRRARGEAAAIDKTTMAVTWSRDYSDPPNVPLPEATCDKASQVLSAVGARRIIVGHTVQSAINAACNGTVWRIDTGMSTYYGGKAEVLEITPDGVNVLTP